MNTSFNVDMKMAITLNAYTLSFFSVKGYKTLGGSSHFSLGTLSPSKFSPRKLSD